MMDMDKEVYIDMIKDCFKKLGVPYLCNIESPSVSLNDVDCCLECVANILCEEGFRSDDEPNSYGMQLESTIDFLLDIRRSIED